MITRSCARGCARCSPTSPGSGWSARREAPPRASTAPPRSGATGRSALAELTARERSVLELIARGRSNKAIAAELKLSEGTVKGYVSVVLGKLGVEDRTQAALFAVKHGLVEASDL